MLKLLAYQFCTFDVRSQVLVWFCIFLFFLWKMLKNVYTQSVGGVERFSQVTLNTPSIFRLNNHSIKSVHGKYVYLNRDVQKQPFGQNDVNVRTGGKVGK